MIRNKDAAERNTAEDQTSDLEGEAKEFKRARHQEKLHKEREPTTNNIQGQSHTSNQSSIFSLETPIPYFQGSNSIYGQDQARQKKA